MPRLTLDAIVANRFTDARRHSPWIDKRITAPCGCRDFPFPTGALVIAHIWDSHVKDQRDWSKAQLLAWIRAAGGDTKPKFTPADEKWLNRFGASLGLKGRPLAPPMP